MAIIESSNSLSENEVCELVHNTENRDYVIIINGTYGYTPEYYANEESLKAGIEAAFGDLSTITSIDVFRRVERLMPPEGYAESWSENA